MIVEQPLAPVDLQDFELLDARDALAIEDIEDEHPTPPPAPEPVIRGRAPGVIPAGASRFGAGDAGWMPAPDVPPTNTRPAYGLVGVPDQAVTTRDVKVALTSFSLGALVVYFLGRFSRRNY